ncbi:bcl-2-related ovarian killer protein isoform X2 [Panthera uncia]|uniref:bcl-2-related ovarian killer protein isoform X2 n=1 Tax=Panthera uncia TaxID=29064 RepID=UPI0020FFD16A|nr:bcl-2-related ovarian killer protein isoform X2 [Panthera uncia]
MEVLRRSSVFAAEIMDAFDRSPTDKELVAQAKALGREFVHARLLRAGLAWNAPERAAPAPGGRLAEVCAVLLRLGDELELIRPSIYRNVARQLNISLQSETVVTDAFLAVAAQIFSAGHLEPLEHPLPAPPPAPSNRRPASVSMDLPVLDAVRNRFIQRTWPLESVASPERRVSEAPRRPIPFRGCHVPWHGRTTVCSSAHS